MPDVTVRNDTSHNLNVAFRFVAPANWTNTLTPGNSWTTHLASTPYTVEVRLDLGSNKFSAEDSWAIAGDISTGYLAGAASVTLGALSFFPGVGGLVGNIVMKSAAEPLMQHARQAGGRFAQDAHGMVITIGGVWIPFGNKTYAVRFDDDLGYSLWDMDHNVRL